MLGQAIALGKRILGVPGFENHKILLIMAA